MENPRGSRSVLGRFVVSRLVLALVPIALALSASFLLLSSCAERRSWTPYSEPASNTINGEIVRAYAAGDRDRIQEEIDRDNASCVGCHAGVGEPHGMNGIGQERVPVSCVECHGGNGRSFDKDEAHPHPSYPEKWRDLKGANPERSYTLILKENLDWVQFVNPGDLRVANRACGGCHPSEVLNVSKSIMTTASHFFGVASYVNGITSNKRSIFAESYSPEGLPQIVNSLIKDAETGKWRWPTPEETEEHSLALLGAPIPHFEVAQTATGLRTFEQGSRLGGAALGFNGLPTPLIGLPDKLEDPGRPNNKLSDRGFGTLNRVDLPLLNVTKTRLNDPHLSFLGTNDQPGDYRSSGCTACHMVYANDRDPVHSGPYAQFGNMGHGNVRHDQFGAKRIVDPTMTDRNPGHPLMHEFTTAIPSSQCMTCHMHQPNSFVNPFFGYQMWVYETDAEQMWSEEQVDPSHKQWFERVMRNPEGAAVTGKWGDVDFLKDVSKLNPSLKHTQFSDYHGHGWVFRAVFKTDRKGNLLDKDGNIVPYDDPKKFEGVIPELGMATGTKPDLSAFAPKPGKPVHLKDIHAEYGMHCVDCHFEQDVHGNGMVYAEYQAAVEIRCHDCHGTTDEYARLETSGPASRLKTQDQRAHTVQGTTPWRKPRFERHDDGKIIQRSMLYKDLEWEVTQIKNTVTRGHDEFNERAFKAKMISDGTGCKAHSEDKMECYSCHTSWITSCFGCHLPQKANWKTPLLHAEGTELRNYASYNPQVARDDAFMLGVSGNVKNNVVGTVRSSSAVLISSQDAQRRVLYPQVPTISASGMSSQVFNTHFAHTVRKTETRACTDCHLSVDNDNNAWMAQVFLLGTNYVNFMGYHVYVGSEHGFFGVRVTEWEEPQALIGSNLHRMAYPDNYKKFVDGGRIYRKRARHHGPALRGVQLRGEYLFTVGEKGGFRAYDVANIANKDFAEKVLTQPFSPLGHDTHVSTKFATGLALPTNNHINMAREYRPENHEVEHHYNGKSQNMHELYRYAYVSDRFEGLIVIDIDTLSDWEPRNNFLKRVVTFNPDGILDGAENITVAGTTAYICCPDGIAAVDLDDPLNPRVIAGVKLSKPTSITVQFRYAFVTYAGGVTVLDVTDPVKMKEVSGARVSIADARNIYVARTYGYVAGGADGLIILDVENPEKPKELMRYSADGAINDLHDVKVAMTYDTLYAYLADGENGMHILQLVSPEDGGRSAYGYAPEPRPKWIGTYESEAPVICVSKGLDRDRAADESGHQMTVFGRIGGRPFNLEERERFYMTDGLLYKVNKDGQVFYQDSSGGMRQASEGELYGESGRAPASRPPLMGQ